MFPYREKKIDKHLYKIGSHMMTFQPDNEPKKALKSTVWGLVRLADGESISGCTSQRGECIVRDMGRHDWKKTISSVCIEEAYEREDESGVTCGALNAHMVRCCLAVA
jgi:hypothetical protein